MKKGQASIDFYKFSNTPDQMIIFEVNVDGLKLYEDPMVEPFRETSAFFTMENISSDRLKLI